MNYDNLEKKRKDMGYSQEKFCEYLGIPARSTYTGYLSGKSQMPADRLDEIAKKLGVSTDYILGRSKCTSVENHYINKHLGISDDAINGLREMIKKLSTRGYSAFNFMLSNPDKLKNILEMFVLHSLPLYDVPVMVDSKGKREIIDTKKGTFALARSEDVLSDIQFLPFEHMHYLLMTFARDALRDGLDELVNAFRIYSLDSGDDDISLHASYLQALQDTINHAKKESNNT